MLPRLQLVTDTLDAVTEPKNVSEGLLEAGIEIIVVAPALSVILSSDRVDVEAMADDSELIEFVEDRYLKRGRSQGD